METKGLTPFWDGGTPSHKSVSRAFLRYCDFLSSEAECSKCGGEFADATGRKYVHHDLTEVKELKCEACKLHLCLSCGQDVGTPEARRAAHATCEEDGDDAECPLAAAFAIASAVENLSSTLDHMRDKPSASRSSGASSRRQRSGGSSGAAASSVFTHGTSYAGDEGDARAVTSAVEKAKRSEAARDVTLTEALQRLLRALCPPPALAGASSASAGAAGKAAAAATTSALGGSSSDSMGDEDAGGNGDEEDDEYGEGDDVVGEDDDAEAEEEEEEEEEHDGAEAELAQWHCPACTFINEGHDEYCTVCETPRPDPGEDAGAAAAAAVAVAAAVAESSAAAATAALAVAALKDAESALAAPVAAAASAAASSAAAAEDAPTAAAAASSGPAESSAADAESGSAAVPEPASAVDAAAVSVPTESAVLAAAVAPTEVAPTAEVAPAAAAAPAAPRKPRLASGFSHPLALQMLLGTGTLGVDDDDDDDDEDSSDGDVAAAGASAGAGAMPSGAAGGAAGSAGAAGPGSRKVVMKFALPALYDAMAAPLRTTYMDVALAGPERHGLFAALLGVARRIARSRQLAPALLYKPSVDAGTVSVVVPDSGAAATAAGAGAGSKLAVVRVDGVLVDASDMKEAEPEDDGHTTSAASASAGAASSSAATDDSDDEFSSFEDSVAWQPPAPVYADSAPAVGGAGGPSAAADDSAAGKGRALVPPKGSLAQLLVTFGQQAAVFIKAMAGDSSSSSASAASSASPASKDATTSGSSGSAKPAASAVTSIKTALESVEAFKSTMQTLKAAFATIAEATDGGAGTTAAVAASASSPPAPAPAPASSASRWDTAEIEEARADMKSVAGADELAAVAVKTAEIAASGLAAWGASVRAAEAVDDAASSGGAGAGAGAGAVSKSSSAAAAVALTAAERLLLAAGVRFGSAAADDAAAAAAAAGAAGGSAASAAAKLSAAAASAAASGTEASSKPSRSGGRDADTIKKLMGLEHPIEGRRFGMAWNVAYEAPADAKREYEALMAEEAYYASEGVKEGHIFGSETMGAMTSDARRKWTQRVASEFSAFNSLCINWESTLLMRSEESRMDLAQAIVIGPRDTAYANGIFVFDLQIPATYPDTHPACKIRTTEGGAVRFNPNLYAEGKVCLSLLGTWSGPGWVPGVSSLAQVLLSIQSAILVEAPLENEPSYEGHMRHPIGRVSVAVHNTALRVATLRTALLSHLKAPPPAFRRAVMGHFFYKKDELCAQAAQWAKEAEELALWDAMMRWQAAVMKQRAAEGAEASNFIEAAAKGEFLPPPPAEVPKPKPGADGAAGGSGSGSSSGEGSGSGAAAGVSVAAYLLASKDAPPAGGPFVALLRRLEAVAGAKAASAQSTALGTAYSAWKGAVRKAFMPYNANYLTPPADLPAYAAGVAARAGLTETQASDLAAFLQRESDSFPEVKRARSKAGSASSFSGGGGSTAGLSSGGPISLFCGSYEPWALAHTMRMTADKLIAALREMGRPPELDFEGEEE